MGAKKKFRNRVYDQMLAGAITPDTAREVLGKKPLPPPRRAGTAYRAPQRVPAAVKSAGSRGSSGAAVLQGTGQAYPPGTSVSARPALEWMADTYSDPAARESARTYLAGLDGGTQPWVPPLPGLVREAEGNPDPREREGARAAIQKSMAGPGQAAAASMRMLSWQAGTDGAAGWQLPSEPVTPGLQIAVPGTAGR